MTVLHCFAFVTLISPWISAVPILGGHKVNKIEPYKFMVSLQQRLQSGGSSLASFRHICGGTLVSKGWILTAAHCVFSKNLKDVRAVVGEIIPTAKDVPRLEIVGLELFGFNENSLENDIALVKVSGASNLMPNDFLSLPYNGFPSANKLKCEVLGYGSKMYGFPARNELYAGAVEVLQNTDCTSILGQIMAPQNGDEKYCAVGNGTDTCEGDSGGPMICSHDNRKYVYGITSNGIQCSTYYIPSIYTKVAPFVEWINSIRHG